MFNDHNSDKKRKNEEDKKPYKCTGCGTPLSIYDETCPNCERRNPKYLVG